MVVLVGIQMCIRDRSCELLPEGLELGSSEGVEGVSDGVSEGSSDGLDGVGSVSVSYTHLDVYKRQVCY